MNDSRPTFGVNVTNTTVTGTSGEKRPEVGAIWKKISRTNSEYMTIRLNLSRDLINKLVATEGTEVSVDLVAFPNRNQNGDDKRPAFRIYEEAKRT